MAFRVSDLCASFALALVQISLIGVISFYVRVSFLVGINQWEPLMTSNSASMYLERICDFSHIRDVIFGQPFLREVDINAKRFKGMITLYKGDDEVNEKDVMNGVSHAYQKLKGFYKGVLNLGPDYIRNAKTEEWITREHISVHELE
ncbi:hypothetical protein Tco_1308244 [Tanacetum coccineum]